MAWLAAYIDFHFLSQEQEVAKKDALKWFRRRRRRRRGKVRGYLIWKRPLCNDV